MPKYIIEREIPGAGNGQPAGETAKFIKFVLSPAGQKLVAKAGFVPLAGEKEKSKKKSK